MKEKLLERLDLIKKAVEDGAITKFVYFYLDTKDDIGTGYAGFTAMHELFGTVHVGLDDLRNAIHALQSDDSKKEDLA